MDPKKLARKILPSKSIRLAEEAYRKGRVYALQGRYGFPARGLRIIAVTGTNGKTTTCNLLNQVLKHAGRRTAMFTTAVIEIDGKRSDNRTHRTVPLTSELLQLFRQARAKKVDFVILEVTSQALHQHKILGIPIEVAVMTNLTQDHLDYHGSMERYAAAKARLFNRYCDPAYVVLNRDDDWYRFFADRAVGQELSYGQHTDATLQLIKIDLSAQGTTFEVAYGQEYQRVSLQLLGEFNVYNALAAMAAALTIGLSLEQAAAGVGELAAVPGRMEQIDEGQDFGVIVDFAYTPDALEKVLKTLQLISKGQVIAVFGATGDRDKGKRPLMGAMVAKHADRIFLTDDETYTEDPDTIRQAVYQGIVAAGGKTKTTIVPDRLDAIKAAFAAVKNGDVVLLAGIGHEDYRNMGGQKLPWDERQIARKLLVKT